jgi:hypothetical protein
VALLLSWIDDHFARTGRWPRRLDGPVPANRNETWINIDQALRKGLRGLPGRGSLARLVRDERGVRNPRIPPPLAEDQIIAWAQEHRRIHGDWPTQKYGAVVGVPSEDWGNIDSALRVGCRGLPGGDSLARLLQRRLGVPNMGARPPLTCSSILAWADDHFEQNGCWPTLSSGTVSAAPDENWEAVDDGLRNGYRGLPGGSSLAQLLQEHRGKRNPASLPLLSEDQIVRWAIEYHHRTGQWPSQSSGEIPGTGETWNTIIPALRQGRRGLRGGDTLGRLLTRSGFGGHGRPWTAEEDRWAGSLPAEEVVRRTGRTPAAIKIRRNMLRRDQGTA